jgi:hypothetical protein
MDKEHRQRQVQPLDTSNSSSEEEELKVLTVIQMSTFSILGANL